MFISASVRSVLKANKDKLMAKDNVVAVGAGKEFKDGKATGNEAVVCFVKKKVPTAQLSKKNTIPKSLKVGKKTVPTDVIEVGEIRALGLAEHRTKQRPIMPGISCGHFAITAGTLGLFVEKNGATYILSNNHVIANSNRSLIGDPIYQPGPLDGGTGNETVALLDSFVPIEFGGTLENLVDAALAKVITTQPEPPNEEPPEEPTPQPPKEEDKKDCAVTRIFLSVFNSMARLFKRDVRLQTYRATKNDVTVVVNDETKTNENTPPASVVDFTTNVLNLGAPSGAIRSDVQVGEFVKKSGRTTGYTEDEILAIDVVVDVDYGPDGVARFVNQIIAGPMSDGGDSGSAMFDNNNNLVGLLFAGSDTITIFNPIDVVFQKLGIDKVKS